MRRPSELRWHFPISTHKLWPTKQLKHYIQKKLTNVKHLPCNSNINSRREETSYSWKFSRSIQQIFLGLAIEKDKGVKDKINK